MLCYTLVLGNCGGLKGLVDKGKYIQTKFTISWYNGNSMADTDERILVDNPIIDRAIPYLCHPST